MAPRVTLSAAFLCLGALACSSDPAPLPAASLRTSVATDSETSSVTPAATPEPYRGPVATLRGTVHIKGDPAPDMPETIPADCAAAEATHGKLFRVGQDGALADALVAVSDYAGYVPPPTGPVTITIRDCSFSARTIGLGLEQRLDVKNLDPQNTYIPMLEGARSAVQLVAMPNGDPVKLTVPRPARYRLIDEQGRRFMTADVFVLRFATFGVTGLDGRYEIKGIPVGKAKVSALLPAANMLMTNQPLELHEGDNTLDLELTFDAKAGTPAAPASSEPPAP